MRNRIKAVEDLFLLPFVYPSAWLLKRIRRGGVQRLPLCKNALLKVGLFPIENHYYEPQFDMSNLRRDLSEERPLPGVDFNIQEQLELLEKLVFADELKNVPTQKTDDLSFYFNNAGFGTGDAEYWYQLIRLKKPKRIIEIGSGNSTLMAVNSINRNREDDAGYECEHVCIEPYEMPWLENTGVSVIRKRVEDIEISFFWKLEENDILFIDSSHIIRPDGDVLFEYLELLPTLNKGVIVHVHDIFSPRNYPSYFLIEKVTFWNEQYLLEAFLSHNRSWKVIGSLNYLHHHYYETLKSVCPFLSMSREPGSFYIQKKAHNL